MNIADGLIQYLMLVSLLTFHEFGHAWMAWKCGDDTARLQGRLTLNPLAHIDPIGTVLLPLAMIFLPAGMGRFLVGWARPVPVNPTQFNHPARDEAFVTLAGPGMNLILAILLVAVAKAAAVFQAPGVVDYCLQAAELSLVLCFFNLIPIPPLDGSHLLRLAIGMTWETYMTFARFGFILVIIILQVPLVRVLLAGAVGGTLSILAGLFGLS